MNKPVLMIMAAGMGSRFGGLKQIEPLGPKGETILDYSIRDAKKAGFETVVFIIKEAIKKAFIEKVGKKAEETMEVRYAYQEIDKVPNDISGIERNKPWGTAHAIYCAKNLVDGPFVAINADDFYGYEAFKAMFDFLSENPNDVAMVGYQLSNTLSENGSVTRGVCEVNADNQLINIDEILSIKREDNIIKYQSEGKFGELAEDTIVSMNFWGLPLSFMNKLEENIENEINSILDKNPEKGECYLPMMIEKLWIQEGKPVTVLNTSASWIGVTYPEDKETVKEKLRELEN